MRATADEMEEVARSQLSNVMLGMRAQEFYLYTAALTVSACSLCCPVLRLPPQLDRVRTLLIGLATLSLKGNDAQLRRNQLAVRIGEMFRSLIPAQRLVKLDGYVNRGVKLTGDVPYGTAPDRRTTAFSPVQRFPASYAPGKFDGPAFAHVRSHLPAAV